MTAPLKILAIDDEPNNLKLIQLDLEDENYTILTAEDGVQGWDILQQHKHDLKAILLDRMMPNMDGMEFMAQLHADESVASIPVIMQTAASAKEQVLEGIKAGVYYYLTKPYDRDLMLSIIKAAINDFTQYHKARSELQGFKSRLHLIKNSTFEINNLDDGKYVATFLAQFFPHPQQAIFGITELIINAVEHGNYGIGYEQKSKLIQEQKWLQEIENRSKNSDYKNKTVTIEYTNDGQEITLIIEDEGGGFDWQEFIEISPERATHNHGRGIALAKMTSFDSLTYNDLGNQVTCKIFLSDKT